MFCEYIKLVNIDDLFDDVVLLEAPVHQVLVAINNTFAFSKTQKLVKQNSKPTHQQVAFLYTNLLTTIQHSKLIFDFIQNYNSLLVVALLLLGLRIIIALLIPTPHSQGHRALLGLALAAAACCCLFRLLLG